MKGKNRIVRVAEPVARVLAHLPGNRSAADPGLDLRALDLLECPYIDMDSASEEDVLLFLPELKRMEEHCLGLLRPALRSQFAEWAERNIPRAKPVDRRKATALVKAARRRAQRAA